MRKSMESWVETKYLVSCSAYNASTLFRNLQKVVCSAQGAWCSPNTLRTMVHDKIFRILYSLTPPLIRGSPIRHPGTH